MTPTTRTSACSWRATRTCWSRGVVPEPNQLTPVFRVPQPTNDQRRPHPPNQQVRHSGDRTAVIAPPPLVTIGDRLLRATA